MAALPEFFECESLFTSVNGETDMKPFTTCTLVSALALMATASIDAAVIADPAADWVSSDGTTAGSVVGGTAAGWTYFRSTAANGGTEVALVQSVNTGDLGGPGFAGSSGTGRRLPAVVGDNANGSVSGFEDYELFRDGDLNSAVVGTDLLIHDGSGVGNEYVIVRRTITAGDLSGGTSATIAGSFRNLVGSSSVDVFVYHNANQLFTASGSGSLSQANGTFNINATLSAGDTIDFVVWSQGSINGDETALQATIDVVPEPGSLALLGLGGLMIARRRRA